MGRPKQAARNTERDGCPRVFNASEHWKNKKIKITPVWERKKNKTDESQGAVLEIAGRWSLEGCRLCWGPGCAAG